MESKIIKGWLIVNWKTTGLRVMRRHPTKLSPAETPIELSIKVNIPDVPQVKATGEINLSMTQVKELLISSLEEKGGKDDAVS